MISDKTKITFSSVSVFVSAALAVAGATAWLSVVWATLQPLPAKIGILEDEVRALKVDAYDTCRVLEAIQNHTVPKDKRTSIDCKHRR